MIWFVLTLFAVCGLAALVAPMLKDDEACMPERGVLRAISRTAQLGRNGVNNFPPDISDREWAEELNDEHERMEPEYDPCEH